MKKLQSIRGTYDLYGEAAAAHRHVIAQATAQALRYGFSEIQTPIIEPVGVFARSVGETSDIVSKEMYVFADRNDEQICLRPEGTAAVMRSIIEHKKYNDVPLKVFYAGPMFRYERPQKGRQRQFTQFGVELVGEASPFADIETIALGAAVLKTLGIDLTLELNTLGNAASRAVYRDILVNYFTQHRATLSADSQTRLEKNPLRILDSKAPEDQALIQEAPKLSASLDEASRAFFETVCTGLETLGIPFTVNDRLVRGLDYYSHTAFEFTTTALGAQGTVLAGGRYDDLSSMLGGPALPGVGWGVGIERLVMLMAQDMKESCHAVVVPVGDDYLHEALKVTDQLRQAGFVIDLSYKTTPKAGLKRANKLNASYALLLGSDEIAEKKILIKNMTTGTQEHVSMTHISTYLQKAFA